jgi:hypothetical protein
MRIHIIITWVHTEKLSGFEPGLILKFFFYKDIKSTWWNIWECGLESFRILPDIIKPLHCRTKFYVCLFDLSFITSYSLWLLILIERKVLYVYWIDLLYRLIKMMRQSEVNYYSLVTSIKIRRRSIDCGLQDWNRWQDQVVMWYFLVISEQTVRCPEQNWI